MLKTKKILRQNTHKRKDNAWTTMNAMISMNLHIANESILRSWLQQVDTNSKYSDHILSLRCIYERVFSLTKKISICLMDRKWFYGKQGDKKRASHQLFFIILSFYTSF